MPVSGVTSSESSTAITSAAKSQILGKDDFFKLLITELKYQDPLEPMKDREFIAQMASFSSLEQMYNMNTNLQSLSTALNSYVSTLSSNLSWQEALALLGQEIEFETAAGTACGRVESIVLKDGVPYLTVNGEQVSLAQVTSVHWSSNSDEATTAPAGTGSSQDGTEEDEAQ
ncbi:MAG: flagellar hook capping protein [Syntrophothermus sp.]|uniref:flagellar hook capping FlgD N-terminal domain-containing protein n=1 Tax=Syntrophothermus sp. TaxID=2736299 RepID=UPI00257E7EF5|nr:flagellar hook capping FlgD N-terminal domain-containing protein [Syntrophothermus sp.]NSW82413.1 flagellar hook capping protein [Syntrophothermus sp.]